MARETVSPCIYDCPLLAVRTGQLALGIPNSPAGTTSHSANEKNGLWVRASLKCPSRLLPPAEWAPSLECYDLAQPNLGQRALTLAALVQKAGNTDNAEMAV